MLKTRTAQSAQTALQSQVQSNERLFASPICQSKTTSNHRAGDIASGVKVTVATACTAEAYDYGAAIQTVQQQIKTQASTYFSSQFILLDTLQTRVISSTIIDAKAGTILLVIDALGKWGSRFSNSLKQSVARTIAGKSVSDARSILGSETGVARVDISISGGDKNNLPSDPARINIILRT